MFIREAQSPTNSKQLEIHFLSRKWSLVSDAYYAEEAQCHTVLAGNKKGQLTNRLICLCFVVPSEP